MLAPCTKLEHRSLLRWYETVPCLVLSGYNCLHTHKLPEQALCVGVSLELGSMPFPLAITPAEAVLPRATFVF